LPAIISGRVRWNADEHVSPGHCWKGRRPGHRARGRKLARATYRSQHGRAPARKGKGGNPAANPRQNTGHAPVDRIAADGIDNRHVENVGSQRHDAAVGEQEALHDQHRRHHHDRRAGAKQRRHQRAPDQVARRAACDGKIHHLRGEEECGRQAEQGDFSRRQFAFDLPERHANSHRGERGGGQRGFPINKSVRYVHDKGRAAGVSVGTMVSRQQSNQ
jgi:hypothetical protein